MRALSLTLSRWTFTPFVPVFMSFFRGKRSYAPGRCVAGFFFLHADRKATQKSDLHRFVGQDKTIPCRECARSPNLHGFFDIFYKTGFVQLRAPGSTSGFAIDVAWRGVFAPKPLDGPRLWKVAAERYAGEGASPNALPWEALYKHGLSDHFLTELGDEGKRRPLQVTFANQLASNFGR